MILFKLIRAADVYYFIECSSMLDVVSVGQDVQLILFQTYIKLFLETIPRREVRYCAGHTFRWARGGGHAPDAPDAPATPDAGEQWFLKP